uniref:Uncharacterized protein n=1 Tax=viral metagenome TaxID=1070528 RepID=A0A6M3JWL4_9ZZZZ
MSPAASAKQKTMFCIALSIKKKETPASYSKQAAKMAETMSLEKLNEYCA